MFQVTAINLTPAALLPWMPTCHQGDSSMERHSQACLGLGGLHKTTMICSPVWVACVSLGVLEQLCPLLMLMFGRIHAALTLLGHCVCLSARTCHPMSVSTASNNNILWCWTAFPFLVINNLPQNWKVPTVLGTFFFFLQNHTSLIFLGFFLVCFLGVYLIYGFINFPRTSASSMICLCFSKRKWDQEWCMMPIFKISLTAEKCFLEKSGVLPPVFWVLKIVFCFLGKSLHSTPSQFSSA